MLAFVERGSGTGNEPGLHAAGAGELHAELASFDSVPWLPCTLALDIPVVNFTVRHLLQLGRGSIVETNYHQSSDLPLRANGQLVGWTEFEVVGDRLAVRLTDLS